MNRIAPTSLSRLVRCLPARRWLTVLLAYAILRPLFGLAHEVSVALLAWGAHALVATGWWQPAIAWLGLDPVYTGAAIRALGGVQVKGLAIAGPLGTWLHSVWPAVCLAPELVAPGAGVSMVAAPGAPALGHGLAAFGADVVWLVIGGGLFWRWRRRSWSIALGGLLIGAQIAVNHLLDAQVSLADIEASGLPFAIAVALPGQPTWVTTDLARLPPRELDLLVGATLLVVGVISALVLLALVAGARRLVRGWRPASIAMAPAAARRARLVSCLGSALAVGMAVSPVGALAVGESNWQASTGVAMLTVAGAPAPAVDTPPRGGSSVVTVERNGAGWQYLVNGRPRVIRGVGYNPQYANLDPAQRSQLYRRDFGAMKHLGINTIEGWFETQFDETTLDAAAAEGIGVLMPFELNQDWPYENPNVQQSILDHVSDYVDRYKDQPAVRMWAPGNEDMHRILYPNWTSKENDPATRARADAFAAFLPVLVDRIHELDPNHPVVYRDAEDIYLGRLKAAFARTGVDRPWLVYGANVYTARRLQEIVQNWPAQWLDGPLLISEFAPGGVGPAERPLGFQVDWSTLRQRPDIVLGGLAYTWATNGPEQLDRVFGLVDPEGQPTDGALAALSSAYLADRGPITAGSPSADD
jgi:glycosyl hydrolase family 2